MSSAGDETSVCGALTRKQLASADRAAHRHCQMMVVSLQSMTKQPACRLQPDKDAATQSAASGPRMHGKPLVFIDCETLLPWLRLRCWLHAGQRPRCSPGEMTGLDLERDVIIEIACLVTDGVLRTVIEVSLPSGAAPAEPAQSILLRLHVLIHRAWPGPGDSHRLLGRGAGQHERLEPGAPRPERPDRALQTQHCVHGRG